MKAFPSGKPSHIYIGLLEREYQYLEIVNVWIR
jgi:hypothetical protein